MRRWLRIFYETFRRNLLEQLPKSEHGFLLASWKNFFQCMWTKTLIHICHLALKCNNKQPRNQCLAQGWGIEPLTPQLLLLINFSSQKRHLEINICCRTPSHFSFCISVYLKNTWWWYWPAVSVFAGEARSLQIKKYQQCCFSFYFKSWCLNL